MNQKKPFPWVAVILGAGCVSILCIGFLLAGGIALFTIQESDTSTVPEPVVTVVVVTPTSEPEAPPPAPSPVPVPTEPESSTLTGAQYVEEYSLYDDFSSDALYWPVYDDGKTIMKYENEAYSIQIAEPEYIDWAYLPVDFVPYEIWFDVQGPPGQQNGTFGVFCQYQDADNHYYVEFDLQSNEYIIAQYLDGEDIPLTKQNSVGQFWYETDAFKSPPTSVNHIGVSCYLNSITLFINDEWVDEVSVPDSFDQPGKAAFFVYAFSFADADGYKIFIDNVDVYQPVQ